MKTMIKNHRTKQVIIGILSAMFLSLLMLFVYSLSLDSTKDVKAEVVINTDANISDNYYLGDKFDIPNAEIVVDGQTAYTVKKVYMTFPDGSTYDKKEYVLNQEGEYKLLFVADSPLGEIVAEKQFSVSNLAFAVTGGGEWEYREQLNMTEEKVGGLGVILYEGGTFKYNAPLNISESSLEEPIATIYPYTMTNKMGMDGTLIEAYCVVVRLTDCYDASNYIDLEVSWSTDTGSAGNINYNVCFRAGTAEEMPVGLSPNPSESENIWYPNVYYEGECYRRFHKTATRMENGPYGRGGAGTLNADDCGFKLYYDYKTSKVYAQGAGDIVFVTDLSSELIYNNPFGGFKTGEVYLSVFGDFYNGNQFNLEIGSIYGLADTNLNMTYGKDTVAPTLYIDENADEMKMIKVAKGDKVELMDFVAVDSSGIAETYKKVYYAYGTNMQANIAVIDGKFRPISVGEYTAVFGAVDSYGNVSEKYVKFNCINNATQKTVALVFEQEIAEDISFVEGETKRLEAGKTYTLAKPVIRSVNPFETYCTAYMLYGEEKIAMDLSALTFAIEYVGDSQIVFEYGDAVFDYKAIFNVQTATSKYMTITKPVLPEYFIKDAYYTLDACKVKSFETNDILEVEPDVYVSFDGANNFKKIDYSKVLIEGASEVKFRYVYNETVVYETEHAIRVVDVGFGKNLDLSSYFVGDFDKKTEKRYSEFKSKVLQGENKLTFINVVSFNNFAVDFEIPEEYANFSTLTISLTDYYDRTKKEELIYCKDGSEAYYLLDGVKYKSAKAFYTEQRVFYTATNKTINIGGVDVPFASDFISDKILLSFTLGKISGESVLKIFEINTQRFGRAGVDSTRPDIVLTPIEEEIGINKIVKILLPTVTDILSPIIDGNVKISVFDENMTALKEAYSGETLQNYPLGNEGCFLNLSAYGVYMLKFDCVDQSGVSNSATISIYVDDVVPPTITLHNSYNENTVVSGKLGHYIPVSGYTASDNFSEVNVSIMVITPQGTKLLVGDDREFVAQLKGVYTVRYLAVDEAGNYASMSYKIEVK